MPQMSQASQHQAAEEDRALGSWPRRLLHVQSMRSFCWQPGNIYNNVKEPRYNALSYTWGRWALQPEELLHVAGLEVAGVPWGIPRVNPQHSRADEFADVIKQAAFIVPGGDMGHNTEFDAVDFVWVDIACIDQRFGLESMLEIGRQAVIFRGAASVYVWLCRMSSDEMVEAASQMQFFGNEATIEANPIALTETLHQTMVNLGYDNEFCLDEEWFQRVFAFLRQLRQEPWFTSLWTLQEAFLRKDAIFLSREGDYTVLCNEEPEEDGAVQPFSLETLLTTCEILRLCIERNMNMDRILFDHSIGLKILDLLDTSGFNSLIHDDPMELYRAATYRQPSNELDAIYGIMQVFGFRLGQSNPRASTDTVFTIAALEDELGAALMGLSPVLSQCYQREIPISRPGENWRVSRFSSAQTSGLTGHMPWEPGLYTSECSLSPERLEGLYWGRFKGKACAFATLEKAWSYLMTAYEQVRHSGFAVSDFAPWANGASDMCISLDFAPDLFQDWRSMQSYHVPRGLEQHMLAKRLVDEFKSEELVVLCLGSWADVEPKTITYFGLVLLKSYHPNTTDEESCTDFYWRRLGICTWEPSYFARDPQSRIVSQRLRDEDWIQIPDFDFDSTSRAPFPTLAEANDSWVESESWHPLEGLFG